MMIQDPSLQNDSHIQDLFGIHEYAPEKPKKRDFLPWHRPRKQFVRDYQWLEQIDKMIGELSPENNVLKYLGLPGDDLLDLRYFHKCICTPKNLKLRFLGFNSEARSTEDGSELNISLDEINKLPLVDPSSDIIGDDICQIANTNSVAWDRSKRLGPYDVINIDLCDGFGKHPLGQFQDTHYNTLNQLMTLQARRTTPWLLLLTTRTGNAHVDPQVLEILKSLYKKNLEECHEFLRKSSSTFNIKDDLTLEEVMSSHKGGSDVFIASLCKWIASLGLGQKPMSKIEIKSIMGYNVNPGLVGQDLISLAIKVEPTFIASHDDLGLARPKLVGPTECTIAVQILDRLSKVVDVDDILKTNAEIRNAMIEMTVDLLKDARYDVSNYNDWLNRAVSE